MGFLNKAPLVMEPVPRPLEIRDVYLRHHTAEADKQQDLTTLWIEEFLLSPAWELYGPGTERLTRAERAQLRHRYESLFDFPHRFRVHQHAGQDRAEFQRLYQMVTDVATGKIQKPVVYLTSADLRYPGLITNTPNPQWQLEAETVARQLELGSGKGLEPFHVVLRPGQTERGLKELLEHVGKAQKKFEKANPPPGKPDPRDSGLSFRRDENAPVFSH